MRSPTAAASSSRSGRRSRSSTVATTSAPTPCCSKVGMKKGPWTPEEDKKLSDYVRKEGEGRWRTLPTRAGLARCGKSCRLRWMNYLRPSIKHGDISQDEEDLILRLHRLLGNRWALIAGRIPGRTDNEIKNYWNTHLSRKLISQGIDPRNHKPLGSDNPNSNPSSGEPPVPHSNTNFNPLTPSPEKANASGNGIIINNDRVVDYFHGNNNDHEAVWQNSDNSTGGHVGKDGSNDDIDDLSSFLDSLINDDMFLLQEQQHLQQQQQISGDGSDANDRTNHINLLMNTSSADFRVGSLWGDSVSSIDALDEDLTG